MSLYRASGPSGPNNTIPKAYIMVPRLATMGCVRYVQIVQYMRKAVCTIHCICLKVFGTQTLAALAKIIVKINFTGPRIALQRAGTS